jgi:hypothetical protein
VRGFSIARCAAKVFPLEATGTIIKEGITKLSHTNVSFQDVVSIFIDGTKCLTTKKKLNINMLSKVKIKSETARLLIRYNVTNQSKVKCW